MNSPTIELTPRAAEVFREACSAEQKSLTESRLRIGAKPGGCSGYKYELEWNAATDQLESDLLLESQGIQILVDRLCLNEVLGSLKIDYSDSNLVEQGFVFIQLSSGQQCGCGESFTPVRDLPAYA
ncbi:MAG TPA: iron-sulfur cluster assembly accessory protein [Deltaproteobacteria bacterium]|nr:iron-sulfur cluster assembly accessory protein [Deltaproteobacteria bacterium]|tara:strand:+ start:135 stop:512 length:378 start_codon:yes stop_codon:yes gene_type:complete